MQEIWDIILKKNFWIIDIEEGEESQITSIDQLFNKIIKKIHFTELRKNMPKQIQEAHRTPTG